MINLPNEFEEKMKALLGDEFEDYIKCYDEPRYYGLRVNTEKISVEDFVKICPFEITPIPWIDNGFYYDFDTEHTFTPEDLEALEKEMKKIAKENLKIERFELPRAEALELMKDEPYKVELINDLPEDATISFYKQGDFVDPVSYTHLTLPTT